MGGELDFDPFEAESFPGLEFYLSGTRDVVTMNAYEASGRRVPLISIARQGYMIRHALPGDFAPIPPRDAGMIPLNEAGADRPARVAAPVQRYNPPPEQRTHELAFGQSRLRLRRDEDQIVLQGFDGYNWHPIIYLNPESGRVQRYYFGPDSIQRLRRKGFCMSRDGAITIANPTPRNRDHVVPAEAQLGPLPAEPIALPEDMPFTDKILAYRERMNDWQQFVEANADFINQLRQVQRGHPNQDTRICSPADDLFYTRPRIAALDRLREQLGPDYNPANGIALHAIPHPEAGLRDVVGQAVQEQGGGEGLAGYQYLGAPEDRGHYINWANRADNHLGDPAAGPVQPAAPAERTALIAPEPWPNLIHHQGTLTNDMQTTLGFEHGLWGPYVENQHPGLIRREIVSFRKRWRGPWAQTLEDTWPNVVPGGPIVMGEVIPGNPVPGIFRCVLDTQADGTLILRSLTAALNDRISALIAAHEEEMELAEAEAALDEDYEGEPRDDDNGF